MFAVVLFALAIPCAQIFANEEGKQKTVVVIMKQSSVLHQNTVSALLGYVKSSKNSKVNFQFIYSDDSDAIKSIADVDYVISVGAESADVVLAVRPKYPVLFTLIPKQTLDGLIKKYGPISANYYAIYLTQPVKRMLRLSEIILGRSGRVGAAFSSRNSRSAKDLLVASELSESKLKIKFATDYSKPINAMSDALSESDIYLAMYDAKLLNRHTAKWLLYMAYKMNKPIIGFSNAYTKAGAVASIYSPPDLIGKQSGEWVVAMLDSRPVKKYQYPKYFTVTVNERIQRILRLQKINAAEIESRLLSMESRGKT